MKLWPEAQVEFTSVRSESGGQCRGTNGQCELYTQWVLGAINGVDWMPTGELTEELTLHPHLECDIGELNFWCHALRGEISLNCRGICVQSWMYVLFFSHQSSLHMPLA